MISVTSVTDRYILQPTLLAKHRKTLEWLSSSVLWKRELAFFQKLLDQFAKNFQSAEDKKKIDHFQNLIVYYNGELVDSLASRLRQHEKKLAETLESRDESKTEYFMEHDALMNELESFNNRFVQIKGELFSFIESAM
jgi:DNA primase large subunit